MDSNTIIVGGLNIPLISGQIIKQKINKKTPALNNKIDQIHLTDIYSIFYPKMAEEGDGLLIPFFGFIVVAHFMIPVKVQNLF